MAALTPPVTADDEHERMRQERDYWKSLFDSVIEQLPEPAVVLNAEEVVTHWNGGMGSLTGVDPETAVGDTRPGGRRGVGRRTGAPGGRGGPVGGSPVNDVCSK